jgi:hypothetical protein
MMKYIDSFLVKGNQITLKKMFMIATATHGRGQVKEREE